MGLTVWLVPRQFYFGPEKVSPSSLQRETLPRNVIEYAQRPQGPIHFFGSTSKLEDSFSEVGRGDIVMTFYDGTIRTIATVMAKLDDKKLLETLSGNFSHGQAGLLLKNLEEVEFDLKSSDVQILGRSSGLFLWTDSEEFGVNSGFSGVLNQLGNHFERRRLYGLLGAQPPKSSSQKYKLLDFGEGVINGIFSRLGSARTFRVVGFLALLALFTFAGLVELWCWLTLGGEFLGIANNSCMHLFSRSYIQHATELSFSLTGFLFVGVSVVAVITRQSSDEPTQTAELTIVTGEEIPEVEGTYSLYRDEIERYVGGSRIDSTLIGWSVVSNSPESLIAYREQKLPVEPPDGTYEIWNSITGPTPTEGDAWRLHETTDQQRDDEPLPDWLQGPNGEIDWWIVPDTEPQLEAFKLKLKRAVGYAVSASILGVIIQSYPWNLSTDPDPWLETLPMHQHLLYGILATIFTFVFIGMAWTSIGLLELIQKSRSAD